MSEQEFDGEYPVYEEVVSPRSRDELVKLASRLGDIAGQYAGVPVGTGKFRIYIEVDNTKANSEAQIEVGVEVVEVAAVTVQHRPSYETPAEMSDEESAFAAEVESEEEEEENTFEESFNDLLDEIAADGGISADEVQDLRDVVLGDDD